ncbi:MAG: Fe2+ transport system protein B [Parasphingorhabdus sp.]|jgi:Fe2+ transport system protein B
MSKSKIVFDANHAPREEVDGVLEALQNAGFEAYEIRGNVLWGGGAVCVKDVVQQTAARQVVEEFQDNWRSTAKNSSAASSLNPWLAVPVVLILLFFVFISVLTIL